MQVYGWQALVRAKFSLGPPRQTTLLDTSGGRGEGGEGGGGGEGQGRRVQQDLPAAGLQLARPPSLI
jgi:hypothetical protein